MAGAHVGHPRVFGSEGGSARLRTGLRVDRLGDERLVLDPAEGVVHTLRGDAATTLDAVLRGGEVPDTEALRALVRAGIVRAEGVSRRELLGASGFASALLLTTVLPSATAAATGGNGGGGGTVATVSGESSLVTEYEVTVSGVEYLLFRVAATSFSTSDVARTIRVNLARQVDVLLVGGGGGGGDIGTGEAPSGGGGAGEVRQVSLGVVSATTDLAVTVGGAAVTGDSGRTTSVSSGSTYSAKGGGRGSGVDTPAEGPEFFGSGGGGRSSDVALDAAGANSGGSGGLVNAGGAGGASAGGGGGGAGGAGQSATNGSDGGAAHDIAAFLGVLTVPASGSEPAEHRYVAGGGGGGGADEGAAGAGGSVSGVTVGGRGAFVSGGSVSFTGVDGALATGSGGGGGAATAGRAGSGFGASGVAWIRVRKE